MSVADKVHKLRSLIRLLTDASEVVIKEWESEAQESSPETESYTPPLPSGELFDARRTVLGACGMCMDLVQEPQSRIMEIGTQYYISRALQIAAEGHVADVLAKADPKIGMPIQEIGKEVGIEAQKIARLLRCLSTIHIFAEVQRDHFANSPTSQYMVANEPLRCWLVIHGMDMYGASHKLPSVLFDPVKTRSYSPRETAFQESVGTKLTLWEYFEEPIRQLDGTLKLRPDVEIFNLAMVGGGRVHEPPLFADYPWEGLGSSTIVDVGGGVGGMSLGLARRFPNLRFIVQDLPSMIQQANAIWLRELPEAIETGRTKLMAHDMFTEQSVKGAEVYFMRYLLHDWADDECVAILSHIRQAMNSNSRILIADQVIHPTVGSSFLKPAPFPLPANYGWAHKYSNQHDLNMLTIHNGMERTPDHFSALAKRSGLRVVKVWECRGLTHITEMRDDSF
ncbi:hypothetical protein AcV5_006945 [Taiwanofungus camphoratus]|nr:hypothetical protein AcV5_006945 [Antrodia cinnamomea]